MKKISLISSFVVTSLTLTSCFTTTGTGSTGSSDDAGSILGGILSQGGVAQAGTDILNNILGGLLTKGLTEQSLYGTWVYQSPEVRFESESLLAKAGGQVVAANIERKLESYLTKVGIKKGVTTYTFNQDNTYSIATSGKIISQGTYTFNAKSLTLKMNGNMGILNQNCTVGMDGTNLCFLYDADKLLSVMNSVGSILGQVSSTVGGVASVLGDNYKGMKVGLAMSKGN
ncbi:MAG: DUF4923 family protein [Bacteroidaceae bacterium]|nr:DUF4923 family protein [Bacteroidaceae bacterium]